MYDTFLVYDMFMVYDMRMNPTTPSKSAARSEDEVLDQAIQQLLAATKTESARRGDPVTREQLREEGYSERFIAKVESA